jgi:hypothetical protein
MMEFFALRFARNEVMIKSGHVMLWDVYIWEVSMFPQAQCVSHHAGLILFYCRDRENVILVLIGNREEVLGDPLDK